MHIEKGYLKWNLYQKAIEKVNANMNGGWMFTKGSENIDFEENKDTYKTVIVEEYHKYLN